MNRGTEVETRLQATSPRAGRNESQRTLDFVFDATRAADFHADLVRKEMRHSPRLNAMFGFAPDEQPSLSDFQARYHPDDHHLLVSIIPQALDGKPYFERDFRLILDDEVRWLHARGEVLLNAGGEPETILGAVIDITERKRHELDARLLAERYRTLFDSIDEGFCVLEMIFDADGQPTDYLFEEVNPTFERHTGLTNAVGRRARELVPDLERHWLEIYGRVATTGKRERFVQESKAMGRWFEVDAFRVADPRGRRVGLLFTDITERRQNEVALRESEERLRRALDVDTVGVIFFLADGQITDANDAFLRMSGFDRADLATGEVNRLTLTPEEFMPSTLDAIDELERTGQTKASEKQYVRKDDSRWWALSTAKRLTNELGVEFIIDITAAREAEAERRRSDQRLRSVVENIHDYVIYATDADGIITDWTDGAARLKGYPREEVVGRHVSMFYTPDEVAQGQPQDEFRQAAKHGRAEQEAWKVRRDGSRFWANEITTAIRDTDGKLTGFSRISRDLTNERRLAAEREAQFERERKRREAAEAFLGVLSHELRTPVTSIYGTASLVMRDPQRADLLELISDINEEAHRLSRMIEDLLVLSRVDRGLVQLSPEPVLLQRMTPEVLAEVERRGPPATFQLDLPSRLPPTLADPTALRQVLNNLLSNAAKYAGQEGPIEIRGRARDGRVQVTVTDQGPGLGPDPELLFSLFYRAPHTARRASGTGIGLYVARELVGAMDGRLEAQTREEGGASFRFTLPTAPEIVGSGTD